MAVFIIITQSSVSHDPSEIILCWSGAQATCHFNNFNCAKWCHSI